MFAGNILCMMVQLQNIELKFPYKSPFSIFLGDFRPEKALLFNPLSIIEFWDSLNKDLPFHAQSYLGVFILERTFYVQLK